MSFQTIRHVKNGYLHVRKLFFPRPGAKARVVYDVAIPGHQEFIPSPKNTCKSRHIRLDSGSIDEQQK